MMKNLINFRSILIFLTVLSFGLFGASLYFQYIEHLEPCPLCIAQRLSIFLLAITYFFALFIKRNNLRIINFCLQFIFSMFGASMAARQVWLIHTPKLHRPGCMPDMTLLWHYLPLKDLVQAFLNGSEACGEVPWTFLGASMPAWMLGFFIFFIIASMILAFSAKDKIV